MTTDSAKAVPMAELTLRGVILGALITLLFTAANVYLGLKIGLTFATSIPAAVISMAVLRLFATGTILENNIVQTIASAAGTLSAIIFVLPGLVIIGWWQGFPYWLSACTIALGGILGVMYSVPLRRALVTGSDLPYPEGVAAAEVLKVGAGSREGLEENKRGLAAIVMSSIAAAGFSIIAKTKILAEEAATFFKLGAGASSVSTSFSMALIGVGHLVGISVGAAMFVGLLISWVGIVPYLTSPLPAGADLADLVGTTFRMKARFIGAGTIGIAAIWTLLKILGPIISGIRSALNAAKVRKSGDAGTLDITERDLPIGIVFGTILASLVPIAVLLWIFAQGGPIAANPVPIIGLTLAYILVAGIVIASVCGYMAGLIGASNSPISGVGILAVLGASLILAAIYGSGHPEQSQALIAYALFTTAIVFGVATISNDNLQDLKTGQLVGATPWKQQIALVLGVLFGALVIPPVLDLLNSAFGFAGAPGAKATALPAPQAALISALAKGVLGGDLDWGLIGFGAGIGVVVVALDELLGKTGKMRLPPLAVGMGIYLPMALTLLIPVGAVIGHFYNRWSLRQANPEFAERMGVLMATGFIVGESLFGVAFAGIVASTDSDAPLALVGESHWAVPLSVLIFAGVIAALYARLRHWATAPLA
ncbi:MAG: oligopeptide transporter, OPT family [Pseudomonadota bacterium]|uniref:OPT family oligopeptide transporter n=3 Tax=Sphingomonadaceae TaxID=41297 RepID=K9D8L9_SPHYA|nr:MULTISPECIES: oligopeptide transporter, OPT family [Sphingobium]MBT2242705.1 oligopeptide transporter, OPT family [Sphingobium sp. BHU LFT2]ATI82877.1 oligopeptide transporter, OPT family [Sphingobium yanoikuyae]EKU75262.1 OPT family oligopeptide transporter [Sphingobium yanoikuyae ATCC 51230]MDG2511097.1 oligopeptide transporter, OPT family [Sphingobium yanoikuyae]NBB38898.1 oligopeptide transporter, OPT family [Sphingobium yanoikuyae]